MNIQRTLFLFLRHSWLIVLLLALALAGAWIWIEKQTPIYASRAVIEVQAGDLNIVRKIEDVKETTVRGLDQLNTVVGALSSNTNLLAVAQTIGRIDEVAAKNPDGKLKPGQETEIARSIQGQLKVALRRNTRLIEITAEEVDPEKARALAAAVVSEFLKAQKDELAKVSGEGGKNLYQQAEELKKQLAVSQEKLEKYRLDHKAVSVKEGQNTIVATLNDLNKQVTEASGRRAALESDLRALKKVTPENMEAMLRLPSVAALPRIASLRKDLTEKEGKFAALNERYLDRHPSYLGALSELENLKGKLREAVADAGNTLQQQFQTLADTEANLRTMLVQQEEKALALESVAIPYRALEEQVNRDRELYATILTRASETNVIAALPKNPYTWVEQPLVNIKPVRPQRFKTMLIAGFLACVAGVGLILLIDRLDSSIRGVDEAESELGFPVLGAVPEMDTTKFPKGTSVMTEAPGSSPAEAFRSFRASISLLGDANTRKVILMTSSIPSEGKTFNSINLAAALATQGLKVLLIDGDLRRPALSAELLETAERKDEEYRGLTDVLSGLTTPAEAIRATKVPNLSLLPSGRRAPNPAELLAQPKTPEFLEAMSKQYDRVLIDSAPINAVSDTLSLAPYAHMVCLVVRFGKTPKRAIHRALQLLKNAGAKMAGLVMNRMPQGRGAAYYYYYYGDPYVKDSVYGGSDPGEAKPRKKRSRSVSTPASAPAPVPGREVLD